MGNIFGADKKKKITDVDRAIVDLKSQKRRLADYQKRVLAVIEREKEAARELLQAKKRDRAILALKKKRVQEDLLQKLDAWLFNVEEQLSNIEIASRQKAVFESLDAGRKAIKELQRHVNIDDVEKLMDDTAEAKAYQEELNNALSQTLSAEDEEAVLAEFDSLEAEMGLEDLGEAPTAPIGAGPTPTTKLPAQATKAEPTAPLTTGFIAKGSVSASSSAVSQPVKAQAEKAAPAIIQGGEEEVELDLPEVPKGVPSRVEEKAAPASEERVSEEPLLA